MRFALLNRQTRLFDLFRAINQTESEKIELSILFCLLNLFNYPSLRFRDNLLAGHSYGHSGVRKIDFVTHI